jgi:hypothetical protein
MVQFVAGAIYRYELRRGEDIVATGHLAIDEPLEVGQSIKIGKREGVIPASCFLGSRPAAASTRPGARSAATGCWWLTSNLWMIYRSLPNRENPRGRARPR